MKFNLTDIRYVMCVLSVFFSTVMTPIRCVERETVRAE